MFLEQKKGKMAAETYSQQNLIAKGSTITGDIISDGDFRIEGNIQGNLKTPGKVVIGKTGLINGTLKSSNADIEGKFSGKLIISDTLSLKSLMPPVQ
jgi:cytoskeletal protein CcmA (bactofilin family)